MGTAKMTKIGADGDKRVGAQARHLPPPLTFHAKVGAEQCLDGEVDGGPGKLTSLAIFVQKHGPDSNSRD